MAQATARHILVETEEVCEDAKTSSNQSQEEKISLLWQLSFHHALQEKQAATLARSAPA